MSKFDRVLSDEDLARVIYDVAWPNDEIMRFAMVVAMGVQQAVLAKLAEQEPSAFYIHDNKATDAYYTDHAPEAQEWAAKGVGVTALYAHPTPCVSPTSDKTACVSESEKSETQTNSQWILDSSNHIVDNNKMVADMYWINPDYPSYTSILDAFDPIQSAVEVEIGDQFEVSRAKTLPDLTIEVTELEENGDVKDFKVLSGDHIPDIGKMVPEGWQLVPKEPTDAMLSCVMGSVGFGSFTSWYDSASGRYMDMLAAAPKYTGENT